MLKILLFTINAKWIHPSLALRLLKANLDTQLQNNCVIEETNLRQDFNEKLSALLRHNAKIIGISVSIWNHTQTVELLRALAQTEYFTQTKPVIILGGPEVSHLDKLAEIFSYADYIIHGEGEHSFNELCKNLAICSDPSTLLPPASKSSHAARAVGFSASPTSAINIRDIKTAYHLYTNEDLEKKLIYVESSRGCPYTCTFCLSGSDSEGGLREFPVEQFLAEMDILIERGAKRFKFLDRSFNVNIKRALRITEFFLDRITCLKKEGMFVHFELIPSNMPEELLSVLRRFPANSLRVEIGLQTLNPETSALIGRKLFGNELQNIAAITQTSSAIVHTDLIAGLPKEDLASFAAGFDRLYACKPAEIQLGILKCLPGTAIRDTAGTIYAAEPPYEVLQTDAISKEDMDSIKNFARFWELIINRNILDGLQDRLCSNGKIFENFMNLSRTLLKKFGRNWGIDRSLLIAEINKE
jgi:radical SAM superfamily enzyme YgiQ (UPF0313 family)